MGSVAGDSLVRWKLNERDAGILISDARGSIGDMDSQGANARPVVALGGFTGYQRLFTAVPATAVEAVDTAAKLDLRRNVTVQAIVAFDITAQDANGFPGTLISVGFRDSAAEDLQLLVELRSIDLATRRANIRMRWEEAVGSTLEPTNVGADFIVPLSGVLDAPILITASREWISDTDVVVRYYAGETFLGRDNSVFGKIAGAAGSTVVMGARGDGVGGYENFIEADVESVAIFDRVMSAEEIRQSARLLSLHGRAGHDLLNALVPENVWSTDPESIVQRELFVWGQMLGVVMSKAAELLEDFLPDRAWSFLEDWERVLGLPAGPNDSLTDRRNRLISYQRTVQGHSPQKIQDALAAVFDLTAAQVEILEFGHLQTDDFATTIGAFWQALAGDHTLAIVGGALRATVAIATESRWLSVDSGGTQSASPHVKGSIDRDERDTDPSLSAEISVEVDLESFTDDDRTLFGVGFLNQSTNDLVAYGLFRTGGVVLLGTFTVIDGVQSAIANLGAPPARPMFLNMKFIGGLSYELGTANGGARDTLNPVIVTVPGPTDPTMILLGGFGLVAGGTTVAESIDFDDFRLYTPNGLRVFNWYAFRDPILVGLPDIPGANAIVQRVKPAHTQAAAVSTKALLFDDPGSLFDDGPIGG